MNPTQEQLKAREDAVKKNSPQDYLASGGALRNGQIPSSSYIDTQTGQTVVSSPTPITPTSLTSNETAITLPSTPIDTTNYQSILSSLTTADTTSSSTDFLSQFLANQAKPQSLEDFYKKSYAESGVDTFALKELESKKKLATINAQLG